MAKKQNKKPSKAPQKSAKKSPINYNTLRSKIFKTEDISSYKKTAKIASYIQDKIENRRNTGRVTNKYIHQATLSYFKDQEKKKAKAAAQRRAKALNQFNKLRSKIWEADQDNNIPSYQKTAEIASYVKERIKNKRTKGPVTDRYIHQATIDFLNQQKKAQKEAKAKRNAQKLVKFNKLRSRIWEVAKDLITAYSDTAVITSYVQDKIKKRRKKGPVTDRYLRKQVLAYFEQIAPPGPPEEEIPEVPEEEEEIPEVPGGAPPIPPIVPPEPVLDGFFNDPFPYYDLDAAFDILLTTVEDKEILVKSPLSTFPQFKLNTYSYMDTFKSYVDEINGTFPNVDSQDAPEVLVMPKYDPDTNTWFLWVFEVGNEPGVIPATRENIPPIIRDLQRAREHQEKAKEPEVPKEQKEPIVGSEESAKAEKTVTPKATDFEEKRKLVEYKRAEMERIAQAIKYLQETANKYKQDIKTYREMQMNEEAKKAMAELSYVTTEIFKLNRQYIKISSLEP